MPGYGSDTYGVGTYGSGGLNRFQIITSDSTSYYLSDVERALAVDLLKFSRDQRSATGKLSRLAKANKRKFTFQWKWLPFLSTNTLDGGVGGQALQEIFNKAGVVSLYIPDDSNLGATDVAQCFVSMDGFEISQEQFIGDTMYWDVTFTLEEV